MAEAGDAGPTFSVGGYASATHNQTSAEAKYKLTSAYTREICSHVSSDSSVLSRKNCRSDLAIFSRTKLLHKGPVQQIFK